MHDKGYALLLRELQVTPYLLEINLEVPEN